MSLKKDELISNLLQKNVINRNQKLIEIIDNESDSIVHDNIEGDNTDLLVHKVEPSNSNIIDAPTILDMMIAEQKQAKLISLTSNNSNVSTNTSKETTTKLSNGFKKGNGDIISC